MLLLITDKYYSFYLFNLTGIGLTIVATGFLFFVYYFDWIIYGHSKFTLIKTTEKTECKSRSLPINKMTMCGAQDINTKVKIKLDDSYFIVDTNHATNDAQCTRSPFLCLETKNIVTELISSRKMSLSIKLGNSSVLLERPYGQSLSTPTDRPVA